MVDGDGGQRGVVLHVGTAVSADGALAFMRRVDRFEKLRPLGRHCRHSRVRFCGLLGERVEDVERKQEARAQSAQ